MQSRRPPPVVSTAVTVADPAPPADPVTTGARLLVDALIQEGVDVVFGYPGGAIMPVYDALVGAPLRHILVRHEQGAALAANGYARATGRVGVCMATSGPGAANLLTGIADAHLDSVPVVAITGQVPSGLLGTDAFQEMDVLGVFLPVVKHSFLVRSVGDLPRIVSEAFRVAREGRPGPVLIDLPKDVALAATTARPLPRRPPPPRRMSTPQDLDAARALLSRSERPVVYGGGGIGLGGAVDAFRDFVHRAGLPTVLTLKGLGTLDSRDPLLLGMLGMHGSRALFSRPEHHLSSGGLGTMGFGLPAAIGAQLARPDAVVVTVSGDGSFLMNVQELATVARYDLPVKILVIDNQALGMVRQWQTLFFGNRLSEVDLSDNPDFGAVARAFRVPAFALDRRDQVTDVLGAWLSTPGPALLHARIDPRANVWPLVPPNASNRDMVEGADGFDS